MWVRGDRSNMEGAQARSDNLVALHGTTLVFLSAQLTALGVTMARNAWSVLLVAFFFGLLGIITLLPLF